MARGEKRRSADLEALSSHSYSLVCALKLSNLEATDVGPFLFFFNSIIYLEKPYQEEKVATSYFPH